MLPIVIINLDLCNKTEDGGKNLSKKDFEDIPGGGTFIPGARAVPSVIGASIGYLMGWFSSARKWKSRQNFQRKGYLYGLRTIKAAKYYNARSEIIDLKEWCEVDRALAPYRNIKFKMLFLPLKRGIDLKKFVEDYGEDVYYCSCNVLGVCCDPDLLKENAHKTLIPSLGMKSAVELPALALWESTPKEAVYFPLSGLSEEEIYQVIEHICNTIKEAPDISLADLGRHAGQYRESLERKKRPLLIQQNEVHIAANNGSVYAVAGDNNRLEQPSSAVGVPPEQWQQFIDVLRENGMQQREQGERMMELLGQIKLAVEAKDEAAAQEKVGQVKKLLKTTGSNVLQGINLTGSLATIAGFFL